MLRKFQAIEGRKITFPLTEKKGKIRQSTYPLCQLTQNYCLPQQKTSETEDKYQRMMLTLRVSCAGLSVHKGTPSALTKKKIRK